MSLIRGLKAFLRGHKRAGCTQVFCPGCGNELVSCPLTTFTDTDLVRYVCGQCRAASAWDFDAPAPIWIEDKP